MLRIAALPLWGFATLGLCRFETLPLCGFAALQSYLRDCLKHLNLKSESLLNAAGTLVLPFHGCLKLPSPLYGNEIPGRGSLSVAIAIAMAMAMAMINPIRLLLIHQMAIFLALCRGSYES